MGVNVYWWVVALVIGLGMIMPQQGRRKNFYIIVITLIQIFVCGFRYMYLTGDLRKYSATFYELPEYGWFSNYAWQGGRNAGFQWSMKLVAQITDGDFQVFLFLLAVITQVSLAILVYRYSPKPWLSYLVWNCMAFYVTYDFTTIKQGLAMAILMVAMVYAFEENLKRYVITMLIAGFVHAPSICFLPAYWIMRQRINRETITLYIVFAGVIYLFRDKIVDFVTNIYYAGNAEMEMDIVSDGLGGRFFMMILILGVGFLLKGFRERNFEGLFNIIVIAAIFQMFSGFDNIFTRLADYYFQFVILFIPMIFYESMGTVIVNKRYTRALLPFNDRSLKIFVAMLVVILIWWYHRTCLGVTITYAPDDYTNFRFMWQVLSQ